MIFMRKSQQTTQQGTQNVKTHNRKTQEAKQMSIMLKATGTGTNYMAKTIIPMSYNMSYKAL